MKKIFRTDINTKKVFNRGETTYYQVYADSEKHFYIYEIVRTEDGEHRGYEIIKAQKHTNPDGNVVYRYAKDEEFGKCAWATIGTDNTYDRETEDIITKAKEKVFKNAAL